MMAEITAGIQKLPDTHVGRTFTTGASAVENLPGGAKAVMEEFHGLRHSGIGVFVRATERR